MKTLLRPLLFCSVILAAPVVGSAADAPATVPAAASGFSVAQLTEGLKSGLGSILQTAMAKFSQPGAVTVTPPSALAKVEKAVAKVNPAEAASFSTSLSDAVAKVAPQAAQLIKDNFQTLPVTNAPAVLAGGADAGTQYLRTNLTPAIREKLLPLVKQATASTGLAAKAKDMLASAGPLLAMSGNKSVTDLDGYVCDQVIDQSFKLIAKEEAAVRANPALLTDSPLAQKVFAAFKK